jgi:4'-phosphopantetheinyl transferase EntD
VIEELLPASVAGAELFGDPVQARLFPEEEAQVAHAVDKRRREFSGGRWCAHRALERLGVPPAPIGRGERGAPQWPTGVVGAITHCSGYRGAAVARSGELTTLGIDAEPHSALPDGVLDVVSLQAERCHLRELAARDPGTHWDRLLFSAKESIYKAWFPVTGEWLGFEDAQLHFSPGEFTAKLAKPARLPGRELHAFTGRWLARDGLVLTAVAVA